MSLLRTAKRYLSLKTHRIRSLPIAILEPHSACNCRCIMCDIWKGNEQASSMAIELLNGLLSSFKRLDTRWVVMTGGEAMMHPKFFEFCKILKEQGLKITVLTTGILLKAKAEQVCRYTDEVIVSLDGPPRIHDQIRRIPNAYRKLAEGVEAVRRIDSSFSISARSVIQKENFRTWPDLVHCAQQLELDKISFLPADVTSEAFNRPAGWAPSRQDEVKPCAEELPEFEAMVERIICEFKEEINKGFIAEHPEKLRNIFRYYAAFHGRVEFPPVRCNAPWVSSFVQSDGTVRPCFFLPEMGSLNDAPLHELINREAAIADRAKLDPSRHETCGKCVCMLYLHPRTKL